MGQQNGGNPRLDRIEGILETIVTVRHDMQQEHKMLLRAQVVEGDELRQLQKRTDERFQSLAAAQERMDDALKAVMGTLDGFGKRTDERFEAQIAADAESARRTDAKFKELADLHKETEMKFRELADSRGSRLTLC